MKALKQSLIIFFLLISITPNVKAQECTIDKDPFSNETVVKYDFMRETVVYEHTQEKTFLKVKLNLDGEINVAFNEGTPFLLKTEKGNIISLVTSQQCIPVSQVSGTRVISMVVFVCEIDDQALADLEESRVTLIRHADGKGSTYDLEINKKVGTGFKDGAQCIQKSI